jgi:hypothetical protein
MIQLPLFANSTGQAQSWLCEETILSQESPLQVPNQHKTSIQNGGPDYNNEMQKAEILNPIEVLGIDPLLMDVSAEATGILAKPAWLAVFATRNLLDHLGLGNTNMLETYEQHIYNIIWQARLELDLVSHPEHFIPFYYHTESTDLYLALVIRNEFQPPAAVIGLAEDFYPTEREIKMEKPWLLAFRASQILYIPTHVCPQCGAKAVTHPGGQLYKPFLNLNTVGMEYDPYFGYVRFDCLCHLNMSSRMDPQLAGSMRVVRVGDAMLPVNFVSKGSPTLSTWGLQAAEVNNARVRQAVKFLAANANQRALAGSDALKALVYAISAGQAPERSYEILKVMILGGTAIWQPARIPKEVEVSM